MRSQANPANLCLVTAVDVEFKTATSLLSQQFRLTESGFNICQGFFGDRGVTILQCGMGAYGFAEWLNLHLKNNSYNALIVVGLAGALDSELKAGDAVIYDLCRDGRGEECHEVRCDERLAESLRKTFQLASLRSFHGTGITVSRIITDAEDKLQLRETQQAIAVDMESFEALRVAAEFGLPAVAVRVISDEAIHDLPDFNYASEPDGKINYQRLTVAMLRRPAASFRFLANLKLVLAALRESLQVVLRV